MSNSNLNPKKNRFEELEVIRTKLDVSFGEISSLVDSWIGLNITKKDKLVSELKLKRKLTNDNNNDDDDKQDDDYKIIKKTLYNKKVYNNKGADEDDEDEDSRTSIIKSKKSKLNNDSDKLIDNNDILALSIPNNKENKTKN
nr:7538_t:CDS:2 [Entrophospora candida]